MVIVIIALLVGLTYPAIATMLSHARKAKCASNLRQIGTAMLAFAGDNNGNLPLSGGIITYAATPTATLGWTQQLEPYLGSGSASPSAVNGIFQCPDANLVLNNIPYSYFNGAHAAYAQSGGDVAVNMLKIHAPSEHIIAGDIAFNPATPTTFTSTDADKDDFTQDPAFNGYTSAMAAAGTKNLIPIHGGSVNLVFADGHVENVRSFDNTKMTTVYPGTGYPYLQTFFTPTP